MSGRSGKAIADFITSPTVAGFVSMVDDLERTLKQRLLGYKHFDQMQHAAETLINGMPEIVFAHLKSTPSQVPIDKRTLHMSIMHVTTATNDKDMHVLAQTEFSIDQGSSSFSQRCYPLYIGAPHVFTRYIGRQRAVDAQPLKYFSEDFEILCGVSLVMSFARAALMGQQKVPVDHSPGIMPFRNGLLLGDIKVMGDQLTGPFGKLVHHKPKQGTDGRYYQEFEFGSELFNPRLGLVIRTFIEENDFLGRQAELHREMTELFSDPDTVALLKKANRVYIERAEFNYSEGGRFAALVIKMGGIMMGPNWQEHETKRQMKHRID